MISRLYRSSDRNECVAAFTSNSPHYFLPDELIQFEQFLDHLPGPYFVVLDGTELLAWGGYATGRVAGEADICWTIVRFGFLAVEVAPNGFGSGLDRIEMRLKDVDRR